MHLISLHLLILLIVSFLSALKYFLYILLLLLFHYSFHLGMLHRLSLNYNYLLRYYILLLLIDYFQKKKGKPFWLSTQLKGGGGCGRNCRNGWRARGWSILHRFARSSAAHRTRRGTRLRLFKESLMNMLGQSLRWLVTLVEPQAHRPKGQNQCPTKTALRPETNRSLSLPK